MIYVNFIYDKSTTQKCDEWFNYRNSGKFAKIRFLQIKFLSGKISRINSDFFNIILVLTKVNLLKKILSFIKNNF
jgi:hypothetical protein